MKYAIRQIGTTLYIPNKQGSVTSVEPTDPSMDVRSPRLFDTYRDAEVALRYWLRGSAYRDSNHSPLSFDAQPGRYREKMEIVTFELTEK